MTVLGSVCRRALVIQMEFPNRGKKLDISIPIGFCFGQMTTKSSGVSTSMTPSSSAQGWRTVVVFSISFFTFLGFSHSTILTVVLFPSLFILLEISKRCHYKLCEYKNIYNLYQNSCMLSMFMLFWHSLESFPSMQYFFFHWLTIKKAQKSQNIQMK